MKCPILEMFVSIQGEGKYTGIPSIFIRFGGCNLRCVFGNSRCDTPYSSFELEEPKWKEFDEFVKDFEILIEQNPNVKHVVITGGEPMLYAEQVKQIISKYDKFIYTVETNGTLPALEGWLDSDDYYKFVDLWSISPKLSTSVDHNCKFLSEEQRNHHDNIRINIKNISSYIKDIGNSYQDYQLKFVYSGKDSVAEIKDIIAKLKKLCWFSGDIDDHVMLMPEGISNDQLNNIQQECFEVCLENGWRFCDRLHIRLFGDKRGV